MSIEMKEPASALMGVTNHSRGAISERKIP